MLLLFDSVPVRSGGLIQLRDELTNALADQAGDGDKVLLLSATHLPSANPHLEIVHHRKPKLGWLGRWWWYNRAIPRLAGKYSADVIYSLSGIVSQRVAATLPTVTTVNNMVPFSPVDTADMEQLSVGRIRIGLLRRLYIRSVRRAHAVVLHSHHALDMLQQYAGDISKKAFVVLTGVPTDLDSKAVLHTDHPYGGRPYLLYFSAFYPYKNHVRLVDAYAQCLRDVPELPDLIIAGMPMDRDYFDRVQQEIAVRDLGGRVKYIGSLEREKIPVWIYHALINFFPSTCETNPVTVAEVLALGGVLACSNVPPFTEIVGDAAEYFDPRSIDSIAASMVSLLRDPERRSSLKRRATERARELSWRSCATEIWRAAVFARTNFRRPGESGR